MTRRYRRKRHDDNSLGGLILIALVFGAAYVWQTQEENPMILVYTGVGGAVIIGAIAWIAIWKYRHEQRKIRALDISQIDQMDPLEFEKYVGKLLISQGFRNVRLTERYDYGVDVIADKDGVKWGVQVKRYSKLVKAEAVRQVYTALVRYKCDRAMVVTNSTFSRPARELAADNNCVLIDRDTLSEWIVKFQEARGTS